MLIPPPRPSSRGHLGSKVYFHSGETCLGSPPAAASVPKPFPSAWGMAAAPPCPLGGECRARDVCHCSLQGRGAPLGARGLEGALPPRPPGSCEPGVQTPRTRYHRVYCVSLAKVCLLLLDRPRGCADTYTEAVRSPAPHLHGGERSPSQAGRCGLAGGASGPRTGRGAPHASVSRTGRVPGSAAASSGVWGSEPRPRGSSQCPRGEGLARRPSPPRAPRGLRAARRTPGARGLRVRRDGGFHGSRNQPACFRHH
ncbi:hypothetical protein VULLAG_LOCUS23376 [Vulpes lagopus]